MLIPAQGVTSPIPFTLPPRMTMRLIDVGQFRLASQGAGEFVSGPRQMIVMLPGNGANLVADQLLGRVCWRASLDTAKPAPPETIGAMQVAAVV